MPPFQYSRHPTRLEFRGSYSSQLTSNFDELNFFAGSATDEENPRLRSDPEDPGQRGGGCSSPAPEMLHLIDQPEDNLDSGRGHQVGTWAGSVPLPLRSAILPRTFRRLSHGRRARTLPETF
jgi:hypothetical protein